MECHKIEGGKENRHRVAKALLDMFELVTNDMMDDSRYLCSRICCPYIIATLQIFIFSLNCAEHWIRHTFLKKMNVALSILEMIINYLPLRKLTVNPFHFQMKVVSIFPCQKVL